MQNRDHNDTNNMKFEQKYLHLLKKLKDLK